MKDEEFEEQVKSINELMSVASIQAIAEKFPEDYNPKKDLPPVINAIVKEGTNEPGKLKFVLTAILSTVPEKIKLRMILNGQAYLQGNPEGIQITDVWKEGEE